MGTTSPPALSMSLATGSIRCWTSIQRLGTSMRDRATSERGDISSNLVWVAGFVLAAILVVGVLYAKLSTAAENIDVSPGV